MFVNPFFQNKTKHNDIDYQFVQEKVVMGNLITQFMSSSYQITYILTKYLPRVIFLFLCNKIEPFALCLHLQGANKEANIIKETYSYKKKIFVENDENCLLKKKSFSPTHGYN